MRMANNGILLTAIQRKKGKEIEKSFLKWVEDVVLKNETLEVSMNKQYGKVSATFISKKEIEFKKENHNVRLSLVQIKTSEHYEVLHKYLISS